MNGRTDTNFYKMKSFRVSSGLLFIRLINTLAWLFILAAIGLIVLWWRSPIQFEHLVDSSSKVLLSFARRF